MVATPIPDPAAPVRYVLTHRAAEDDRVDIVLDLFRGTVPVHSRIIAQVQRVQAVLVMVKCRRYLDLRGVVPAGPIVPPAAVPVNAVASAKPATGPVPARAAAASVKPMAMPASARAEATSAKPAASPVPARLAASPEKTSAMSVPARAAASPAKPAALPVPVMPAAAPVRPAAMPVKPRRERAAEPRTAAPVAAFDWMFQAG